MAKIGVLCVLLIMVFGCDTQEKQTKLSLKYEHNQRSLRQIETPVRHNIKVEPNIAEAWLDSNMSATVEVPVDTSMYVDYKNYTSEQPDIHYEYGSSNPFYVTSYSPDSLTITIAVSVNSDYPVQETETIDNETTECTENCTVDNSTVTDNMTWSDTFFRGVAPTQQQRIKFLAFIDNLTVDTYRKVWIGNIDNMTYCDNETLIDAVISNYDNMTYSFKGQYCGGMYWTFGGCGVGNEISAFPSVIGDCACRGVGYTIRPLIGNANWGGVEGSCTSNQTLDNQTLQVILEKK